MDTLGEYSITEQAETLIDEGLGAKFVKDLLDWDEDAPEAWTEMALAYARLAFVKGYQLRREETKDGRTRSGKTFANAVGDLGRPIPEEDDGA